MEDQRPTAEGIRRFPPDGIAQVEGGALTCVCEKSCAKDCMGGCGCEACEAVTLDYLHSGMASDEEIAEFNRRRGPYIAHGE